MSVDVVLPDKAEFKIGEVCEIAGVKPFVLRYWETEFAELAPAKGAGGQRTYSKADVELILRIKHLLYEERFTVAGAKKRLSDEQAQAHAPAPAAKASRREKAPAQPVPVAAAPAPFADPAQAEQLERLRRAVAEVREELVAVLAMLR